MLDELIDLLDFIDLEEQLYQFHDLKVHIERLVHQLQLYEDQEHIINLKEKALQQIV